MKTLNATLILSLLAVAAPMATPPVAPIAVSSTPLTPTDLAAAMNLYWWSFKLHFDKPVSMVRERPCELRRKPDGTWEHVPLDVFEGRGHAGRADISDIDLKLMIPDDKSGDYVLVFGSAWGKKHFKQAPDFAHTWRHVESTSFIDGCMVLAVEEKDPNTATDLEENMVRVIGLEITTE
jgi:hypothetical protein